MGGHRAEEEEVNTGKQTVVKARETVVVDQM